MALSIAVLLSLTPASAVPQQMSAVEQARLEAVTAVEQMTDPGRRATESMRIVGALLRAGRCDAARPLLSRLLAQRLRLSLRVALFRPTARSGDADCMRPVAGMLERTARHSSTSPANRIQLLAYAAALFRLAGDVTKADAIEPPDLSSLESIHPRDRSGAYNFGSVQVMIGFSDPPLARQHIILEILRAYSETPHFAPALRALAARAETEPRLLNGLGWLQIAAWLARLDEEDLALEMLAAVQRQPGTYRNGRPRPQGPPGFTRPAIRAASALRERRYEDAASLLTEHGWHLRDEQLNQLLTRAPAALIPYIDRGSYWEDANELARLAFELQRLGMTEASDRATVAALSFTSGTNPGRELRDCRMRAPILARLGRAAEVDACLQTVDRSDPEYRLETRGHVVRGYASRGNTNAIRDMLGRLTPTEQIPVLRTALSGHCRYDPRIHNELATRLNRLRRGDLTAIRSAATAGCSLGTIERLISGNAIQSNRLRLQAARSALAGGHVSLALRLANGVRLGQRPSDSWLAALAEIYWAAAEPERGLAFARRIRSNPKRAEVLITGWLTSLRVPSLGPACTEFAFCLEP